MRNIKLDTRIGYHMLGFFTKLVSFLVFSLPNFFLDTNVFPSLNHQQPCFTTRPSPPPKKVGQVFGTAVNTLLWTPTSPIRVLQVTPWFCSPFQLPDSAHLWEPPGDSCSIGNTVTHKTVLASSCPSYWDKQPGYCRHIWGVNQRISVNLSFKKNAQLVCANT